MKLLAYGIGKEICKMLLVAIVIVILVVYIIRSSDKTERTYKTITRSPNKTESTYKTAEEKGAKGEETIASLLGDTIPGQRYLINNLIIFDEKGTSSQIDHVFINSTGVYVIETKNLSGTIYGDDYRKEWTQVFNYGEQKYRFYNPIMQNETHIIRLKKATGTELPIKSIVVFANNNIEKIRSNHVYTTKGMLYEINAYFKERITPQEMHAFYMQLKEIKENQISDEEHIQNIHKAI